MYLTFTYMYNRKYIYTYSENICIFKYTENYIYMNTEIYIYMSTEMLYKNICIEKKMYIYVEI